MNQLVLQQLLTTYQNPGKITVFIKITSQLACQPDEHQQYTCQPDEHQQFTCHAYLSATASGFFHSCYLFAVDTG